MEDNESSEPEKKGMNPMTIGAVVLGLIIIAGGVVLLSAGNDTPSDQDTMVTATLESNPMEESDQMMESEEGVVNVQIEGGMYYFDADTIRAKEGDTVRVTLTSVEGMHNFVIDEFNVDSPTVEEGESTTVEFVAGPAGEYEFYCSVKDHREMGMVGTLIVE